RHDHPGRAETALQPVLFPETFLQRVQLAVRGEPLDRRDGRSVGLHREERARLRAAAVDENGAGAALCGVAADVRSGQAQLFAEEVAEQEARVDLPLADLAIAGHRNLSHGSVLCAWKRALDYSKTLTPPVALLDETVPPHDSHESTKTRRHEKSKSFVISRFRGN